VICERVVYPSHCLRSRCPYVYAFDEGDTTYFGCVAKVFSVELDLAPYQPRSSKDAYGALKAQRQPRPECRAEVERAYGAKYTWHQCRNPLFSYDPREYSPEAVRLIVDGTGGCEAEGPMTPPPGPCERKAEEPAD
jgi:hypothetical protein